MYLVTALIILGGPWAAPGMAQDPPRLADVIDAQVKTIRGYRESTVLGQTSDAQFLPRVYLDLVGREPTDDERDEFLAKKDAPKRGGLIETLVNSKEFSQHWAKRFEWLFFESPERMRFRALPEYKKGEEPALIRGFTEWLASQIHQDRGWNEIVADILKAQGSPDEHPQVAYLLSLYRKGRYEVQFAQRVPSHFLGIQMWCAACHDHPFDRWKREDFFSLAAFARNVRATSSGDKLSLARARANVHRKKPSNAKDMWWDLRISRALDTRPRFLFGETVGEGTDPLDRFATLLTRKKNTQFANATANRVWAWMMGRGIVHPPSSFDMRNRPLSRSLLDALSRSFVKSGYSLKTLISGISHSQAYQRLEFPDVRADDAILLRGAVRARGGIRKKTIQRPLAISFSHPKSWSESPPIAITQMRNFRFPTKPLGTYRVPDKEGRFPPAELAVAKVGLEPAGRFRDIGQRHFYNMEIRKVDGSDPVVWEMTGGFACDPRFDELRTFSVTWSVVVLGDSVYVFRMGGLPETVDDWKVEFQSLVKSARVR